MVKAGFWLGAGGFGTGDVDITDKGLVVTLPASILKRVAFGATSHFMRGKTMLIPYKNVVGVDISKRGLLRTKCIDLTFLDERGEEKTIIFAPYVGKLKPKYLSEEWAERIRRRVVSAKYASAGQTQMQAQQPAPAQEINFCPNCGFKVSPGDKFCKKCGTPLG